ncbi:hypothetical protein [Paraburkholderia fungorum]|uniref:hypothetical protein n=1 Tax=Paraburkholderia fungorum TaxID=134537 RepID=UPI000D083FE7|nr:hypothetical protein [Paraburkholderia fungorum]
MAPLTRRGKSIAGNLILRRSLTVGLKELVRLDARPDTELDRFLPDARPDRCGPTAQFMTLRCPHCFVALREFGQEGTVDTIVKIVDNRHAIRAKIALRSR